MNGVGVEAVMASVAAASFSAWPYRSTAALTLAFFNMAHFYMFETVESDVMFYVSACTFDVLCDLAMANQSCKLSSDMAMLSLWDAGVNLLALLMWFAYLPATVYNSGIQIVLGLQILRRMWVQGDDMARDTRFRGWGSVVHLHNLRGGSAGKGEAA